MNAPLPAPASPALACNAVTVTYGDVVALRDVSVAFTAGRIHAIVGQNGAGKTTFARVCAGLVAPTAGTLAIGGHSVTAGSVSAARRYGVELVHQSFALPPSFTVAEALEYGSVRRSPPMYSRQTLEARWREHLEGLDVRARLADRIRDLPVETQQGVEIARALIGSARVLILDEPTAVLAPPGIELLFARLRRLQQSGVTVLLILHKIREVLAIAESIAVLRAGRLVAGGLEAAGLTTAQLAEAIVGSGALSGSLVSGVSSGSAAGLDDATRGGAGSTRNNGSGAGSALTDPGGASTARTNGSDACATLSDGCNAAAAKPAVNDSAGSTLVSGIAGISIDDRADLIAAVGLDVARPHAAASPSAARREVLRMQAASTRVDGGRPALDNINLAVARGEIVGIAGVEGNGQLTLVNALAAFEKLRSGSISLGGADVTRSSLLERRKRGLRIIPFERNTQGLSLSSSLWQNYSARALVDGPLLRPIDPRRLRHASRAAFERWSVRYSSVDQSAGALSGGNAQKVILAREIDADATLIIAAQPTRGLDIAATAFVWRALREARERGCAVLVISSDLDELFDISDRIVVMLSGAIVAHFEPPYDLGTVGGAMAGAPA